MFSCPSQSAITEVSIPACSNRIAEERRKTCMVTDFCISVGQTPPAICTYLASLCSRASRLSALPERVTKRGAPGGPPRSASQTQGCSRACERTLAPLGQPGDRDIRLPRHQFQRLAAQQSRDNRHLALNRKALGDIPVDARRGAYASLGEALRRPFGLAPVIIRHVQHSG